MVGHSSRIEHVSALVFRVMGVAIGLDTDQINGMSDMCKASEGDFKLATIHELLGLDVPGTGIDDYARPKALFVKGGYLPAPLKQKKPPENIGVREVRRIGLVVNEPEEIIDIPVSVMRPMPHLVAPHGDLKGLWAVALMPDEMIFMMDIRKLIGRKMPDVSWMGEKQVAGV